MPSDIIDNTISCVLCERSDMPISQAIGCCVECIRDYPDQAFPLVQKARQKAVDSISKETIIDPKRTTLKRVHNGPGLVAMGFYDDHPANCIASWQCPGATNCGYPKFSVSPEVETGYRNLAVFSAGCNFDCLFCQDWIHKTMLANNTPWFYDNEIVDWVDDKTTCVCFCGGNPDVHIDDVTRIAHKMRDYYKNRILRICAETNLTAPWEKLRPFAKIVYESGGGFNIGLKAGSNSVHRALTGASNKQVWQNIELLYKEFGLGDDVPFLRPSLLVIPGYIDEKEVSVIAKNLTNIDQKFSLKLISFLPRYLMTDIPNTNVDSLKYFAKEIKKRRLINISPSSKEVCVSERFIR